MSIEETLQFISNEVIEQRKMITELLGQRTPVEKKFVSGYRELSEATRISKFVLENLKKEGKIPFTQFGRKITFNVNEVLKAVDKLILPRQRSRNRVVQ